MAIDDRERKRNIFLGFLTAVLLLFFIFLIILFLRMLRPNQAGIANFSGLQLIATIYGVNDQDRLSQPSGVAADIDGNVLIADTGKGRVLKFTQRGHYIDGFVYPPITNTPKPKKKLSKKLAEVHKKVNMNNISQPRLLPGFIAVGPDGLIYVTYPQSNLVVVFDRNYKPLRKIQLNDFPIAIAVKGNQLYITSGHMVRIYSSTGKQLYSSGDPGRRKTDLGYWLFPNGITVNKQGTVYVADSNNNRIVALDPKLKNPTLVNYSAIPAGVTIGSGGHLYCVEVLASDIQVFSQRGAKIKTLSGPGIRDLALTNPIDMAYFGGSVFAISDKGNNRVQVVRISI